MIETSLLGVLREIHLFFSEYRMIFGIILIVYGLAECFYGYLITEYSMVLAGFFVGFFLGLSIPPEWISSIYLRYLIVGFLGNGLGVLCYFQRRVRTFAMGFWFLLLFGTTSLYIFGITPSDKVILEIGCIGGFAFLVFDPWARTVVASAMMGAYIFIYGNLLSWYSHSFSEMSLKLNVLSFDRRLPGIIFFWILFFALGFIFQANAKSKYI